jgi:hypothetical protein
MVLVVLMMVIDYLMMVVRVHVALVLWLKLKYKRAFVGIFHIYGLVSIFDCLYKVQDGVERF